MYEARYLRIKGLFRRLCPLTKFIYVLLTIISIAITIDLAALLVILIINVSLWIASKIPATVFKNFAKPLMFPIVFFFVTSSFLYGGGDQTPLLVIGHFRPWGSFIDIGVVTFGAFLFAWSIVLRLLNLVVAIPLLTHTTSPTELAGMLHKLKLPYSIIYTLIIGLRMVPVVQGRFRDIRDAQALRGYDRRKLPLKEKIKTGYGYIPLVAPAILTLMSDSREIDMTMRSRAFGAPIERTFLEEVKMKTIDYVMVALFTAVLAFAIVVRFFYPLAPIFGLPQM